MHNNVCLYCVHDPESNISQLSMYHKLPRVSVHWAGGVLSQLSVPYRTRRVKRDKRGAEGWGLKKRKKFIYILSVCCVCVCWCVCVCV